MRKKFVNKKAKREIDRYPMVEVKWTDITSDASWQSVDHLQKSKLSPCVTKGHLLSRSKGITRIFGDYSLKNEESGEIDEVGNTTIIPNSVVQNIKKI